MKRTNKAKALLSFVLVMAMLLSMCVVGIAGVSAAGTTINYEFAHKNAGYAEGSISISGGSGTYFLYWADDTKALDGYHEIAVISSDDKTPFKMGENTAIPAGATKVIAIKSNNIPETKTVAAADAVFNVPASKQFDGGNKQYDFMALSDIHIDYGNWYTHANQHLANSLEVAAKRDVEFITTCGDNMNGNSGTGNYAAEWQTYQRILAASNYNNPIYETNGNHETYNDGGNITDDIPYTFGLETYKTATGLNVKTEKMQTETYYEMTAPNGDHFIFMVLELSKDPGKSNEFTDKQLKWLEDLLDKYEGDGHRVFINEHALFRGYGAGDNKVTPYYGAGLVDTYPQVKRLKGILEAHKDVIFFSGHTHIDFKYGYNFDNENGKTAYTVHIPSNASTTHPNSSGGLDYIHDINSSQGYLVDVYDDYVILNGTDLAFNAIYPAYSYIVDYSGEELVPETQSTQATEPSEKVTQATEPTEKVTQATEPTEKVTQATEPSTAIEPTEVTTEATEPAEDALAPIVIIEKTEEGYLTVDAYAADGAEDVEYQFSVNGAVYQNYSDEAGFVFSAPVDYTYNVEVSVKYADGTEHKTAVVFEVKNGEALLPEMPERPTAPNTEPTETSTPDETVPTTSTTAPTDPVVEYLYGDVDLNEKINVKDATAVQKYAAKMIDLDETALVQADVTGDMKVNVKDATSIQKLVAKIIDIFPVEEGTAGLVSVGASSSLMTEVKGVLSKEYQYASYDAYMALKKAYMNNVSDTELNKAYTDYKTMKANNPVAKYSDSVTIGAIDIGNTGKGVPCHLVQFALDGGECTIYFSNNKNWSAVNAHLFGTAGDLKTWPGTAMTVVPGISGSSGQAIYKITFDSSKYQKVVFNAGNGGAQTVDITITADGTVYYLEDTKDGQGHYNVGNYSYAEKFG